jgi:hypothetical protein
VERLKIAESEKGFCKESNLGSIFSFIPENHSCQPTRERPEIQNVMFRSQKNCMNMKNIAE